jgi:hypothetical protein
MALRTGEKALRIGLPSGRLSPGEAPARISDNAEHTARMKPRQDAGRRPHRRIRPPPYSDDSFASVSGSGSPSK